MKKNVGITPTNKPIVVTPKARPGSPCISESKVPKDMLIVKASAAGYKPRISEEYAKASKEK